MRGRDVCRVVGFAVLMVAVVYVVVETGGGDARLGAHRAQPKQVGSLHGTLFGADWRVTTRDGKSVTGTVMVDGGKVKVIAGLDVVEVDVAAVKRVERTK